MHAVMWESQSHQQFPFLQGSQAHSFGHHHTPAAADFLEPTPGVRTRCWCFFFLGGEAGCQWTSICVYNNNNNNNN